MEAKRITFPLEGFNLSGGVRIIVQVANGLAKSGHRVRIIVPDYAATPPFKLHDSIELVISHTRGSKLLRKLFYLARLCFTAARDSDICFATGYKTPYYICSAKWLSLSRTRPVYLLQHYEPISHACRGNRFSKRILSSVAKLSYKLPLQKIAVSHWVKDMVGGARTIVIDNGIDLDTFRPANGLHRTTDELTVGTIAGAAEWKGYRVFLDAIQHISAPEKQKIRVLVVSQSQAELPKGVSAHLIKPSGDSELVSFYRACDVFVCCSSIEGFGLPALEAMACGTAAIITACGGVSEYANDANCLMVPPNDSTALAEAIVKLRRNHNLRASLRAKALGTSQGFSLEKMIGEYVHLLLRI